MCNQAQNTFIINQMIQRIFQLFKFMGSNNQRLEVTLDQLPFCLVGADNAGKSTLLNLGKDKEFTKKITTESIKPQTLRGQKQFQITDTVGFCQGNARANFSFDTLKLYKNYIMVVDLREQRSFSIMSQLHKRMKKSNFQRPIAAFANQKFLKDKEFLQPLVIPSQKYVEFLKYCYEQMIWPEIFNFKDENKLKMIYKQMEQRVFVNSQDKYSKYSVSLIGPLKSGKTSVRQMLTGKQFINEPQYQITTQIINPKIGARCPQITISDYPGLHSTQEQGIQNWKLIQKAVKESIVIIIIDLSMGQQELLKHLRSIVQILNDQKRDMNKTIIIGNKKGNHTINFHEIRTIMQTMFEAKTTHYIEINCNDAQNKQKLLYYIDMRYLMHS